MIDLMVVKELKRRSKGAGKSTGQGRRTSAGRASSRRVAGRPVEGAGS
jgi:hypothetical protein